MSLIYFGLSNVVLSAMVVSYPLLSASRTQSNDTVLDDGDPSIVYSEGWEDTPNQLITDYYNNTFQCVSSMLLVESPLKP